MTEYYHILGPLLRLLPPEAAHALTVSVLKSGLLPRVRNDADDAALAVVLWSRRFSNPLGLAAGFDKNAEVVEPMLALGFGFVEVGTVTPRPQGGNPTPRMFRLPEDEAVINRLGFNNRGVEAMVGRLRALRRRPLPGMVGVNVGPNRDAGDPIANCAHAVAELAPLADYLVINVSSPNTPGLRVLQERQRLEALLGTARAARASVAASTPILVKVAPDLSPAEIADVAEVAAAAAADGIVATNTTVTRPSTLVGRRRREAGGLSGRPLMAMSTAVLAELYRATGGVIPLVGVGGVASAADAYAKIRAGASLVQVYTALVYQGPGLIARIKRGLVARLRADGFTSISEAVGTAVR